VLTVDAGNQISPSEAYFGGPSNWKFTGPRYEAESGPCCIRGSSAEPRKNLLPRTESSVLSLKRKLPPIDLKIVVTVR
jgi:hypothetical protein